jgi:LysM repeat protein
MHTAPGACPSAASGPATPVNASPTELPTAAPAPAGPRKYTVQTGDTLRSIAEKFNVSVKAIIDANKLTAAEADSLRVGQELIIP